MENIASTSATSHNGYTRQDLEELIKDVFQIKEVTPLIKKQINRFVLENNMSFKEIARCIVWYDEVAKKKFEIMYGIGIIPNVREEAEKYFKKLELDQLAQQKTAEKIVEYQDNIIKFNIKSLSHSKRQPRQLDMNDIQIQQVDKEGVQ